MPKVNRRVPRIAAALAGALLATFAWPAIAFASHAPPGTKLWGYEAAFTNARILQYDIGTDTFDTQCVPQGVPASSNGRGIAFDPRLAPGGGLWITRLTSFAGDGLIHKVTLPPFCANLGSIKFGDGPGGVDPDDIGALDIDPDNGNLYAAEYLSGILGKDPVSTLFELDENNGNILRACNLPTANGFGNDSLAVVKNYPGLPPGKHLVTDNGEFFTTQQFVIPVTSMGPWTGPASAPNCKIVATGSTPGGRTGYDFEESPVSNDMIATNLSAIFDHDGFPWSTTQATMLAAPSTTLEDVTLRARVITADKEVFDLILDDGSGFPDKEGAALNCVSEPEKRTTRCKLTVEVSTNPIISVVSLDRNLGPDPVESDITFLASIDDGHTPGHVEGAYIRNAGSPKGLAPDDLTCFSFVNPDDPLQQLLNPCPHEEKILGDGVPQTVESDLHLQLFEEVRQTQRILRFFKLHCLVGGRHTITFYNKAEPKPPEADPDPGNNWWRAILELTCVTPGKVTGGGFIDPVTGALLGEATLLIQESSNPLSVGGKATFGFVIEFLSGAAAPTGNLLYNDHGAGVRIKALQYDFLFIVGCTATFGGTADVNSTTENMEVTVFDGGEPGSSPGVGPDTFEIKTDTYLAAGPLVGGNIQIHDGNPC
jgi:hypothetical protein